jgi:orotidine-5'-phosphate decarboxylase
MMNTSPLILALDVPSNSLALDWVRQLRGEISLFKIGMQLFYRYGPDIVKNVQDEGGEVLLDLKLHDIPNTVAKACESILPLNVAFVTIHISGGRAMLEAAQAILQGSNTKLVGITALTSLDEIELKEIYPDLVHSPAHWALHLARLAQETKLEGIVCSAQENALMRKHLGSKLRLVNPGIRPQGTTSHDQKRVLSPKEAIQSGASYLVMGRPILESPDPRGFVQQLKEEIANAVGLPH